MDGIPFVSLWISGQDTPFHEFETGLFNPLDQLIRRGAFCSAESVFQLFTSLLVRVISPVPTSVPVN